MNKANDISGEAIDLHTRLNLETSTVNWKELQRHFASGKVIAVDDKLDLVQVSAAIANDDTLAVEQWMKNKQVDKVTNEQARHWYESDAVLWAVVVKPWVIVQPLKEEH